MVGQKESMMLEKNGRQDTSIEFVKLDFGDMPGVSEMSGLATRIVREHYDPIIGKEQNDYMIAMFQSEEAISRQLKEGYQYYFVRALGCNIGFLAFYPRGNAMYLSKLYLLKEERGKGYSRLMVGFVIGKAKDASLPTLELNVNKNNGSIRVYEKLGFKVARSEKNDIGNGYFMDDYVYALDTKDWQP